MTRKPAKELIQTHPGVFLRYNQYLLALCRGSNVCNWHDPKNAERLANHIVHVANTIIEETEQ